MTQKIPVIYHDKNYLENLLRTTLVFKGKDATYNFNSKQLKKILKDNEGYNITTQLANLYATSTKANNNVTIINNMNTDNNDNEDLLKQIEELKKENNELKKENEELKNENKELKCRKYTESSDEENDKVSKKKYDRIMDLKNKYWKESNEKDITIEKLQNEIKDIKQQHDIKIDNKPLDICNEEFSDDEDEDDDPYKKMEEVEQKNKEKKEQLKQQEDNKKNILHHNLDKCRTELKIAEDENNDKEVKKINKRICKIQKELNKE